MPEFVVYVKDFELGTKIAEVGADLNREVIFPDSFHFTEGIIGEETELVIIDLDENQKITEELILEIRSSHPRLPIVGFFSNVQKRRHKQVKDLGCTWVLPRSSFVKNLPMLIERGMKSND